MCEYCKDLHLMITALERGMDTVVILDYSLLHVTIRPNMLYLDEEPALEVKYCPFCGSRLGGGKKYEQKILRGR